jgi:molybdenum cofactor biosynthesis enzyme MoaA
MCTDGTPELQSFKLFNQHGGKFRLAIINACNLDCFFCHNEAMDNPRRGDLSRRAAKSKLTTDDLIAIANAWAELGGEQINITGGEPMAHPELVHIVESIDKRACRIALNSNAILADRLTRIPRVAAIDVILASLHTMDDATFRDKLGGRAVSDVTDGILALARHGYRVEINYSLGPTNRDHFDAVLDFALANDLDLKAIALVRSNEQADFYGGEWVEPQWLHARLAARGAVEQGTRDAFGGRRTTLRANGATRAIKIEVKNIAAGRLVTDFCRGCLHKNQCGEGIYGLRIGTDALIKPCLLRRERYRPVDPTNPHNDLRAQLLATVHAMVGDWRTARFVTGAPA